MQEAGELVGEAVRAEPGRARVHPSSGEGPVTLALCHDLGPAGAQHGMETRSTARRLCQFSPWAAGETQLSCPIFVHFPYLGLELIWHTALKSRGQDNTCFYDAIWGSYLVLFWEPR